jgi:dynein heavy chain 1, cytosolic
MDELEFLLESGDGIVPAPDVVSTSQQNFSILTTDQAIHLESFSKQSIFKPVHTEQEGRWMPFLECSNPELSAPCPWKPSACKFHVT